MVYYSFVLCIDNELCESLSFSDKKHFEQLLAASDIGSNQAWRYNDLDLWFEAVDIIWSNPISIFSQANL